MHVTTSRRKFVAAAGVALGLAGATAAVTALADDTELPGPVEDSGRPGSGGPGPNIVVVFADDLGYGEVGAYGQRLIATPRLDELAAEGLRFTRAYAPAPVCAPSRCSLLTGLHTGHAAVRTNPFHGPQGSIGDDDTTFAELLRDRGYRTACVGKWGFGPEEPNHPSHPNSRGFEEFYGYIAHGHAHDYYPDSLWHNDERVALRENSGGRRGTYAPDLFQERALEFIERHADGDDPFLLYFAPNVPHAPSRRLEPADYATRPWTKANKGHAAQVSHLDTSVGAIVDLLRAKGLDENTVLLVSSDNGPHDEGRVDPDRFDGNGALRGYKRNLYEGGIRVPLIAWAPGRIAPGSETDRTTPLIDILPTVAELAGAEVPDGIDGISLTDVLGGGTGRPHRYLYWYRNDPHASARSQRVDRGRGMQVCEALRQGDWKLVRFAPGRDRTVPDARWEVELYNLRTDPGERHNVAAEHPRIVARLVNLLHDAWREPVPARV